MFALAPSPCCRKNVFREKGVHVDTVAVSLFLACFWNFVVEEEEEEEGLIGWQRLRKRELPPLEKKKTTTLATAVVWHQGSHSPTAALDASPDLGRAVMNTLSHNASGCLGGTHTC